MFARSSPAAAQPLYSVLKCLESSQICSSSASFILVWNYWLEQSITLLSQCWIIVSRKSQNKTKINQADWGNTGLMFLTSIQCDVQIWHYNSHLIPFLSISTGLHWKYIFFQQEFHSSLYTSTFWHGLIDTSHEMKYRNWLTLKYNFCHICWSLSDGSGYFIENEILNSLWQFTKAIHWLICFINSKSFPVRLCTFLFFNRKTNLKL